MKQLPQAPVDLLPCSDRLNPSFSGVCQGALPQEWEVPDTEGDAPSTVHRQAAKSSTRENGVSSQCAGESAELRRRAADSPSDPKSQPHLWRELYLSHPGLHFYQIPSPTQPSMEPVVSSWLTRVGLRAIQGHPDPRICHLKWHGAPLSLPRALKDKWRRFSSVSVFQRAGSWKPQVSPVRCTQPCWLVWTSVTESQCVSAVTPVIKISNTIECDHRARTPCSLVDRTGNVGKTRLLRSADFQHGYKRQSTRRRKIFKVMFLGQKASE